MRWLLAAVVALSFQAAAHAECAKPAPSAAEAKAAEPAKAAPAAKASDPAKPAGECPDETAADGKGAGAGASSSGSSGSSGSSSSSSGADGNEAPKVITPADCDLCRARSAYLKAGRNQMLMLDNGLVVVFAAASPELQKAAAEFDKQLEAAKEGTAKLDEGCAKVVYGIREGNIIVGKSPDGRVWTAATSDGDLAMEIIDMMQKAVPPKKPGKK